MELVAKLAAFECFSKRGCRNLVAQLYYHDKTYGVIIPCQVCSYQILARFSPLGNLCEQLNLEGVKENQVLLQQQQQQLFEVTRTSDHPSYCWCEVGDMQGQGWQAAHPKGVAIVAQNRGVALCPVAVCMLGQFQCL
ncbi:hypothetical protein SELMODRAFT_402641 [Selaginella moellendorffii]|uniref:Uncharacterized protein n=1 Tax=Selaginella moellendorffii TaxID=88036 RepID=D8QMK5_SELML|nr:hypothetical protein SELMODRAFT_402641 [Selaginella moellendorffii]